MASNASWEKIFKDYGVFDHDFESEPFVLSATQIKKSVQNFKKTGEKEVRILCKQDTREDRPKVFRDEGLFLLPVKNGFYNIIRGEGYVDIPDITSEVEKYSSKLKFELETSQVGNSEMQHLDFAYATSLIRTFVGDPSLVLTIRGRKYTPEFHFKVGKQEINVEGVQTEVDAGYEGEDRVVLVEAKNRKANNTIIRQLYYPYRQWQLQTNKEVSLLFFDRDSDKDTFRIWHFIFEDPEDYNSIKLARSGRYQIV